MKKVMCKNCGAYFDVNEPKCPYCGFISYPGAEQKFMNDLNQIKDELEEIPEIQKKNYKKAMSKQSRIIMIAAICVAAFLLIIAGVVFAYQKITESMYQYDPKEEMLWERETFPQLNAWYEAGEYDKIVEYEDTLYSEDSNAEHSLYNWEHFDFIETYRNYTDAVRIKGYLEEDSELTKFEREDIVYIALWFHFDQFDNGKPNFSEDEKQRIASYKQEVEDIFYHHLMFTDDEAESFYSKYAEDGWIRVKDSYKYANKIYERFE